MTICSGLNWTFKLIMKDCKVFELFPEADLSRKGDNDKLAQAAMKNLENLKTHFDGFNTRALDDIQKTYTAINSLIDNLE